MKKFPVLVFWIIMACVLVVMFVLDFQNHAETGEELNTVGVIAAWVAVVVVAGFFMWLRTKLFRGATKVLEEANKRLDELDGK